MNRSVETIHKYHEKVKQQVGPIFQSPLSSFLQHIMIHTHCRPLHYPLQEIVHDTHRRGAGDTNGRHRREHGESAGIYGPWSGKEHRTTLLPRNAHRGIRVGMLDPDAPFDADGLARASETIRAKARELSMGVIFGPRHPIPRETFNSAQVVNELGELVAVHHKSRLTPADARAYAFPEKGPTAFTFKGIPMGVVICFEGYRFPENVRMLAKDGAKIVFHPQCNHFFTGMAWKLPVHEALLTARAAGEHPLAGIREHEPPFEQLPLAGHRPQRPFARCRHTRPGNALSGPMPIPISPRMRFSRTIWTIWRGRWGKNDLTPRNATETRPIRPFSRSFHP